MVKVTKLGIVQQTLLRIQSLQNDGWFPTYIELYKYLVGFPLPRFKPGRRESYDHPTDEYSRNKIYWQALNQLREYFNEIKNIMRESANKRNYFYVNEDSHWTYIEARFTEERTELMTLIKVYIPVTYSELPHMARVIFDFLMNREKKFCYKIAHQDRQDNICVWICREELDEFIDFLQAFYDVLFRAPTFCPEYKHIGITRELHSSFNEIIAATLYRYLPKTLQPTLMEYVFYLENTWASQKFKDSYSAYDREIVLRSLKCILNNHCPVVPSEYNIVDVSQSDYSK